MSHVPPAVNDQDPELTAVLESAARLQDLVLDAVLVGGQAAALYAGHRKSFDHDHVLADLQERFDAVLDTLESEGEWVTNRITYGKIILGRLGYRVRGTTTHPQNAHSRWPNIGFHRVRCCVFRPSTRHCESGHS